MHTLEIIFWILAAIIFYTYIGYGIVLFVLIKIKRLFIRKTIPTLSEDSLPEITLLVAAYNEQDYVQKKVENSRSKS